MGTFRSNRERRLWSWALAVVAAIYLSASLAGTLSRVLADRGLLEPAFAAGFLLVVAAIIGNAVTGRETRRRLWIVIGAITVFGMILVRIGVPAADRTHLFEYGMVAVLIYEAARERVRAGGVFPLCGPIAVLVTASLGWLDEAIQGALPNRVYDLRDVGVNALAGLLAVTGTAILAWLRGRVLQRIARTPGGGSG